MSEPTDDEVQRLAAAIRERAKEAEDGVFNDLAEAWRGFSDECLAAAGIELADEGEHELAAKWLWRSALMGGNYTLDARRVLRAARGVGRALVPVEGHRETNRQGLAASGRYRVDTH